jgi:hypothetical protein
VSLSFSEAGAATVRLHGRNDAGATVTFEQSITVIP